VQRRLAAILHADVVGYSRLVEGHESRTLRELTTTREKIWRPTLLAHGGRWVGGAGDSMLAEFNSAAAAVLAAMELQARTEAAFASAEPHRRLTLRIGVNLGEVSVDGDDILGEEVNLAQRIESLAAPGEVWVSAKVRLELDGKLECTFEDAGEHRVKNLLRPLRAYRVLPPSRTETGTAAPRATTSAAGGWRLESRAGSTLEFDMALPEARLGSSEGVVVGRSARYCDLALEDESVSRRHARLRRDGDGLTVEDLGSTNGCAIDGLRLKPFSPASVREGARLSFGAVKLSLRRG
jgi:adenylate cyclase